MIQLGRHALVGQSLKHVIDQFTDALAMRGRRQCDVGNPVTGEIVGRCLRVDAVDLVDHQQHRTGRLAKPTQDVIVKRTGALAAIDDKQHEVCLFGRSTGLPCRGTCESFVFATDTAGVNDRKGALIFGTTDAVVPVTGDAGLVMYQCIACPRQCIEQRRLADIGTTDECDEGKHGGVQTMKWKSRPASCRPARDQAQARRNKRARRWIIRYGMRSARRRCSAPAGRRPPRLALRGVRRRPPAGVPQRHHR